MLPKPGLVAIVTGGASGLGEAAVRELAKQGCKVAIIDRDELKGLALVKEIGSDNAAFIKTDVSKQDSIKEMVSEVIKLYGAIHIVVTSAAIHPPFLSITEPHPPDMVKKYFETNVFGTFWVVQHTSAIMTKQEPYNDKGERGVIVMVSSIQGIEGAAGFSIYCGTKGAIHGFVLPMARDLGPFGIRVIAIAPGAYPTPMTAPLWTENDAEKKCRIVSA